MEGVGVGGGDCARAGEMAQKKRRATVNAGANDEARMTKDEGMTKQ